MKGQVQAEQLLITEPVPARRLAVAELAPNHITGVVAKYAAVVSGADCGVVCTDQHAYAS